MWLSHRQFSDVFSWFIFEFCTLWAENGLVLISGNRICGKLNCVSLSMYTNYVFKRMCKYLRSSPTVFDELHRWYPSRGILECIRPDSVFVYNFTGQQCVDDNKSSHHNFTVCLTRNSYERLLAHSSRPFYWHGLTLIPACISNHMHSKVWDEITDPFLNFNGATVDV